MHCRWVPVFIILWFSYRQISGASAPWCYQPGIGCWHGNCNKETQSCMCQPNFGGYDCQYNRAIFVPPQEVIRTCGTCNNNGQCFRLPQGSGCYCDYGYFGRNCQFSNFTVECYMNDMHVSIMTPRVMAVEVHDHPECKFESASSAYDHHMGLFRYNYTFSFITGDPCSLATVEQISPTVNRRTIAVDIRAKSGLVSSLDFTKEFSCEYVARLSPSVQLSQKELFEVDLLNGMRRPANGRLSANENFTVVFYPSVDTLLVTPLARIQVDGLTILNARRSEKMFDIIEKGCFTHAGSDLTIGPVTMESYRPEHGTAITGTFVKFKAIEQPLDVAMTYSVTICNTTCPKLHCEHKELDASFKGIRVDIN